eukprot:1697671-Rhodomonas_salina.1
MMVLAGRRRSDCSASARRARAGGSTPGPLPALRLSARPRRCRSAQWALPHWHRACPGTGQAPLAANRPPASGRPGRFTRRPIGLHSFAQNFQAGF